MSFPYLDLLGFKSRTIIPSADVDTVETFQPGFTTTRIAVWTSWVNARLRKRYGNTRNDNALPLGQKPPELVAAGVTPPPVRLTGRPILGSLLIAIRVATAGPIGTMAYEWSSDGGRNWSAPVSTSPATGGYSASLPGTGLWAGFADADYAADNVYAAATPVPESVLGWIVALVSVDVMRKRGANPQDPMIELLVSESARAIAEVKEAADSKDGLFDLPASEDTDSAVTTGGPLFYSESSPYVSADRQERDGHREDAQGFGTIGGR